MKLIEKLAKDWWLKQRDLSVTGDPESYSPDPYSFEAGFRAAREMAAKASENYPDMARDLYHDADMVICNTADEISAIISRMGEDEA